MLLLFLGNYLFLPSIDFNFYPIIISGLVILLFCYLFCCLNLLSGDREVSAGSSHKNQGTRKRYKILPGRYWWAGMNQRESAKIVFASLHSRRAPPLPPISVPNQRPAPQAKATEKQIGLFLARLGVCFSLPSVQRSEDGSLPRTESLIVIVLWDPGTQAPLAFRAKWSRGTQWTVAANTGPPDRCRSSPLGDTGVLEYGRRRAWR